MPPIVATSICLAFIAWLLWRDFRERPNVTAALWLPFFWVTISATRFISQWLDLVGINLGGTSVQDGSMLDAIVFFVLIVAGVAVLRRRQVDWREFMQRNRWVTVYLLFCLLATVWSDYSFVAFKRWIKLFGQPVMVLVLLTEPDPMESFTRLMKRFGYVLLPLSIVFIKYYPLDGRSFDEWSGLPTNTGITTNKNILGCDLFIYGLFLFWHFLRVRRWERGIAKRNELLLSAGCFLMMLWLFHMANSSTSLGVLLMSVGIILFLGLKFVDRYRITAYLFTALIIVVPADLIFGLHDQIIHFLGRNSSLTGRTEIWDILLHWDINPVFGQGFESFWLGDRPDKIAQMEPGLNINEAHNGYLETYLNIGLLGLAITAAMIIAAYSKGCRALVEDFEFGRFRLAYLAAFLVYNWTEAAFRTHCFPFFIFFLIAIDWPRRLPAGAVMVSDPAAENMEANTEREAGRPDFRPVGTYGA